MQSHLKKKSLRARTIAFYLPQYFPIPENDLWWGKGFTEWTNVAKGRPRFRGHMQPLLPGELGFYDLRLSETREQQAELAATHGIEGFCYWHYWFGHGRQILERPLNEVLASGKPDFPFCVCWANQTWSRTWKGDSEILLRQEYPGAEDQQAHFALLLRMFTDKRYIRVEGKPLFLIYSPDNLPNPAEYVGRWRQMAKEAGLEDLYIVAMYNGTSTEQFSTFDKLMMFGPADYIINQHRLFRARHRDLGPKVNRRIPDFGFLPARYDYRSVVDKVTTYIPSNENYLPCVMPNWDNTARSGKRGIVYQGATPDLFHDHLRNAIKFVEANKPAERLVFLKAWNEWAEGNYLEPDLQSGRARLEATASALG